jgi:hypothetical protein
MGFNLVEKGRIKGEQTQKFELVARLMIVIRVVRYIVIYFWYHRLQFAEASRFVEAHKRLQA